MENKGLCNSEWEATSKGGPLRRMYSVTDAGEAYLDLLAKGLKQYQQTIDYFLRRYREDIIRRRRKQLEIETHSWRKLTAAVDDVLDMA